MALERYEDNDDFSETLFSYHRYLTIKRLCKGKVVVDMACGTGYGVDIISDVAKKVIGLDVDEESIRQCQKKYSKPNLSFAVGDATSMDLPDKSVDVFVSCETIEHLSATDQKKFVAEIRRVLRDDGVVVMTTPNKTRTDNFETKNPFHIKELYPKELLRLMKDKFKFQKLFFMDINMVSSIFDSETNEDEDSRTIKILDSKAKNGRAHEPIYMLVVGTNQKAKLQSLTSVLYDFRYRFADHLWNSLDRKNALEIELQDKNTEITQLKDEIKILERKSRPLIKKVHSRLKWEMRRIGIRK
ncbi:MAG: class I SAM-dependent methyltransferase [Candidatus Microsaccharimonas sp.]